MITCYLRYVIDPYKLAEFEKYSAVKQDEVAGGSGTFGWQIDRAGRLISLSASQSPDRHSTLFIQGGQPW